MPHEFITDSSYTPKGEIIKKEVCKYCTIEKWHWFKTVNGKIKRYYYYLSNGNQYSIEKPCMKVFSETLF